MPSFSSKIILQIFGLIIIKQIIYIASLMITKTAWSYDLDLLILVTIPLVKRGADLYIMLMIQELFEVSIHN